MTGGKHSHPFFIPGPVKEVTFGKAQRLKVPVSSRGGEGSTAAALD